MGEKIGGEMNHHIRNQMARRFSHARGREKGHMVEGVSGGRRPNVRQKERGKRRRIIKGETRTTTPRWRKEIYCRVQGGVG